MEKKYKSDDGDGLVLNNAQSIIDKLKNQENDFEENFFTLVQGNSYNEVEITDSNISNNARFILGLWE